KKGRGSGRYLPQKSSAPYAILITLYRETQNGKDYMLKQELIDAAEASGLSRMPIGPSKSSALPGRFGNPAKEWYSGWSSMKTLTSKGLVVKSSCPAKYMLTEEGKLIGKECLERSGVLEDVAPQICTERNTEVSSSEQRVHNETLSSSNHRAEDSTMPAIKKSAKNACHAKRKSSASREIRSRPSITTEFVDKEQPTTSSWQPNQCLTKEHLICSVPDDMAGETCLRESERIEPTKTSNLRHDTELFTSTLRPCTSFTSSNHYQKDSDQSPGKVNTNVLAIPPVENGDTFSDIYDVVLILDDREQFGRDSRGAHSRQKVAERLYTQFKIQVEIRRLPIGDATWIAQHKRTGQDYVLDFIIERKKVDDLSHSIKDNRYKDQKLRLMRCGLQRLIYLIEGDANLTDASESIKSAAFTTEIHEGFDVQRTRDLADTVRKYGHLTHSVKDYYNMACDMNRNEKNKVCMTFDEFVTKCHDLEKETVSDVFGVQLMQVPQVTEDVALAVLDRYPTVLSLAQAYSCLEGNLDAQEQLLKEIPIRNQSKIIGGRISKNIYKFIWGEGT
ncbi:hypothetical protein KI387_027369, partial [Taxus chinensis]